MLRPAMRKTDTFSLTSNADLQAYEKLVNRRGVAVLNQADFFAISHGEDGPTRILERVVDYRDTECESCVIDFRPLMA